MDEAQQQQNKTGKNERYVRRYAQRPDAQPKVLNGEKVSGFILRHTVRERRERSGKIERGEQDEDHKKRQPTGSSWPDRTS